MVSIYNSDEALAMGFDNYIKDTIMDKLEEMEGKSLNVSELSDEITMEDNNSGCFILYTIEAKQFIKDFWEEAQDTYEDHIFQFGKEGAFIPNPFEDPNGYSFFMEDYGVRKLLNNIPFIEDNWDEEIIVTPEIIKQIRKELDTNIYKATKERAVR